MEVFRLTGISFSYLNGIEPIRDFSLVVGKGEFLMVSGENGSGKTTLLWIMAGLLFPQKGKVFFEGKPLTEKTAEDRKFSLWFRRRVGLLFQEPDVQLFSPTVGEDIAFGPRNLGLEDVSLRVARAAALMGLERLLGRPPHTLSWGQKKRAAIATVLAGNHDILLLDEPAAGLDSRWRDRLMAVLSDLIASGKTIVVVAHDDPEMRAMAAKVVVMPGPDESV
ncbi:MAG: energy-coupling factor ABC transporter ATP-binding protein [candidate division WOR-3 bacterium]